jgi:ribosomal protein L34E
MEKFVKMRNLNSYLMPDILEKLKKKTPMGRTCMEKRRNSNTNGSIWNSSRKKTLRTTPTKMERPSQEGRTINRPKGQMECHSDE